MRVFESVSLCEYAWQFVGTSETRADQTVFWFAADENYKFKQTK